MPPSLMNKTRIRKRRRHNDRCVWRAAVVAAAIWFGFSISFLVVLDEWMVGIKKENEVHNANLTAAVALSERLRRLRRLPKFPIDHRYERNVRPVSDRAVAQCHKALWHTLGTTTFVLPDDESFVITGDIEHLWLRDSAAQIHPLLLPNAYNGQSLVQHDKKLERVVSGLILKTARLIRFDPYANAFRLTPEYPKTEFEREALGRHGYIATWNYELDSACYFIRMLYFFHHNFPDHPILRRREVREAVSIMMDVWIAEQRHEDDAYPSGELFDCVHCGKPYRYNPKELKREGKGTATNSSAGLTWTGFRPSDDPCQYGYLIPANMFTVVALKYATILSDVVWDNRTMADKARKLANEIDMGIRRHGIVIHPTHGRLYAYEVDGFGNSLLMDDANVPSLLSIPYLGYDYDEEVFANTKRFVLSKANPMYHEGRYDGVDYSGIGSPHTKRIPSSIWPMAMIMEGLVSNNATHKVGLVEKLMSSSAGTGWMHESFNPNNPYKFSRPWFCWPDSLFAELVMSLTDACPRPERGRYKVRGWTGEIVNGSAFDEELRHPRRKPPLGKPPLQKGDKSADYNSTLAVVSACFPAEGQSAEFVEASRSNKRSFCKKWNATCILPTAYGGDEKTHVAKWTLINRTLYSTDVDWIMWLDCDAGFTNLEIDWREHLFGHLDKSSSALVTSRDKNGVNLGVLFVPTTLKAGEFVRELEPWLRRTADDQEALKNLLDLRHLVDDGVPQEKINSYIDNSDGHKWEQGEWIAHQVWCKNLMQCRSHFLSILQGQSFSNLTVVSAENGTENGS